MTKKITPPPLFWEPKPEFGDGLTNAQKAHLFKAAAKLILRIDPRIAGLDEACECSDYLRQVARQLLKRRMQ